MDKNPDMQQASVSLEISAQVIQTSIMAFFNDAIVFKIFSFFWGEITKRHS